MQAAGRSAGTVRLYRYALAALAHYLADPEINAIRPDDLKRFFIWLRTDYKPTRSGGSVKPLSDSAIDNHWKALRSFFEWAALELKLDRPDQNLRRARYTDPVIIPFTLDEITRILKACESSRAYSNPKQTTRAYTTRRPTAARDAALILFLLDTGLRVGELCRLDIRHVDLRTGQVEVIPHGSGQKTTPRLVYLGKSSRRALWKYLADQQQEPDAPLFLTDEGHRMSVSPIGHLLQAIGRRAGVSEVHPHRFRHTFAIQFLRNGGDVYTLQKLLGHSTLTMCLRYLALAREDVEAAHRRASPADNWKL